MEEKRLRNTNYYKDIENLIEGFAVQKNNSRIIFIILLILVIVIYYYH